MLGPISDGGIFMRLKLAGLALAALAMLGTTATADPWRDNTGAPREHAAPPPGSVHLTYEIVVNRFGRKIRGSAGTSVFQSGFASFIAEFPVDVTKCVYVATLGRATTDGGIDAQGGYATTVRSNGFPDGVFVQTYGARGILHNRPFHLLVAC